MSQLILMRHGESLWNKKNLFTGWVDVPLSEQGIQEAIKAGRQIQDFPLDLVFTSTLIRAQETLAIALAFHRSGKVPVFMHPGEGRLEEWGKIYSPITAKEIIPVYRAWQLNERMYGALQGLNKTETAEKFGPDQVKIWRRSFDIAPPEGESLEACAARTLPFFKQEIMPHLNQGKNVLISAHGNSLRSIIMELDQLTKEQVVSLELTLGEPIYYTCESGKCTRNPSI